MPAFLQRPSDEKSVIPRIVDKKYIEPLLPRHLLRYIPAHDNVTGGTILRQTGPPHSQASLVPICRAHWMSYTYLAGKLRQCL